MVRQMKQHAWSLEARFSLEVCCVPESELFLWRICRRLTLDFLADSVHSIDGLLYDMPFSQPLLG